MYKIGITGQAGFLGTHLKNNLSLDTKTYQLVDFKKKIFRNERELDQFVESCDVIFHLAAVNRDDDPKIIYDMNIKLAEQLRDALRRTGAIPHVLFSSSSQECNDNPYGNAKKEARLILENWASDVGAAFTGFIIPNVFGPFGKPFYNSFIATFCHLLNNGGTPDVKVDSNVNLIYIQNLVEHMLEQVHNKEIKQQTITIPADGMYKVTEVLSILERFKKKYTAKGIMPSLNSTFELNMFNTYRSYINYNKHFPVDYTKHTDDRGSFVEIIRLEQMGQVSFSTTVPGITRGNHYHTRKIERFSVIKGKALIELRRIDSDEVLSFELDGSKPSYVDMPIWYTHNIKNVGTEELYTMFWINEFYNPDDPDTYFVTV